MRALADRHHSDLYYSLQRLIEDRFGGVLYTPVGHDWWDEGYWQFGKNWGDDRLAQQFLNPAEWVPNLPEYGDTGVYRTFDQHHPERPVYGLSLAAAKRAQGDITHVICTVEDNQDQPGA